MTNAAFVYVTYISSTREKVFRALTDAEFTRQYWGHDNVSDWKPGSKWEHRDAKTGGEVKIVGKVTEYTPPSRMVLTWAAPADVANPAEYSRVTFDLDELDGMVKLTVTHDELGNPNMLKAISGGWPRVLSSLKTLLETGKALNTWAKPKQAQA